MASALRVMLFPYAGDLCKGVVCSVGGGMMDEVQRKGKPAVGGPKLRDLEDRKIGRLGKLLSPWPIRRFCARA
jgi:hypothetical protein